MATSRFRHARRRIVGAALLAPVLGSVPAPTFAQGPTRADALAAIAAYAPRALREQGAPGMSVAITDASGTLQTLTLGVANVDAKIPVTAQTRFPIGSITKSMTTLALMQFVDAGSLRLDAPVTAYLPDFAIATGGAPIVVHQLLSHTAGIPDDYSVPSGYGDAVYRLRDAAVLFPPGTSFSYSNDGFSTAGAILAHLDGRSWADAVQSRVLDALGMSHTTPTFTTENMSDAATGYVTRDNDRPTAIDPPLVPAPPFDFVDPAGSVISTPEDMAAYMRFYLRGGVDASGKRLISEAAFARMTTQDVTGATPAGAKHAELAEAPTFYRKYGLGLSVSNDGADRLIEHTGGISGYTACMQMNLTRGFGVVALSNLVEAPLHPCAIVLYAMRVLRAQSLGLPLPPAPAAPDPAAVAHAAEYAGTYTPPEGPAITVAAAGSGAALHDGAATFRLYARDDDQFVTDDPRFARFLLVFHRDAKHAVTDMTWGPIDFVTPSDHEAPPPAHPAYQRLAGRYENEATLSQGVTRVVIVKGKLTLDGVVPLVDQGDGSFRAGHDVIRFDHVFEGRPQRMLFDDIEYTRIDLP